MNHGWLTISDSKRRGLFCSGLEKKVSSLRDELPKSAEKKSIMDEFEAIATTELPKTMALACAYSVKSVLEEVLG